MFYGYSLKKFIVFLPLIFITATAAAQTKGSLINGTLKGRVKDSAYNFMLTSATVAVYKDADSSLLQFSLPNNFGEFTIQPLPLDQPLRLIITHIGYKALLKKFTIVKTQPVVDLGLLYMYQNKEPGNTLDEVVVKAIAPVRMNGDTVEFNADAFKMDSSATAEDLMRRLPGFTIWSDGEITYNGKKINAVLVEGKPFMGTDATVATQNIPKEALDKIQVYQQRDEKNPLDSTLFANIKLKENKKVGYFGKAGGGIGTDQKYAADGMLSGFNRKLQLNVLGAVNNINKMAGSTDVLMKNSSFQGEGINSVYQSDFSMRGLNRPVTGGVKIQYDFSPDAGNERTNRLNADYFINHNNALINNITVANTFLQADTILTRHSQNTMRTISTLQTFNTYYQKRNEKYDFTVSSAINNDYGKTESQGISVQEKTAIGVISNGSSINETENRKKSFNIDADFTSFGNKYKKQRLSGEFTVGYKFAATENNGNGKTQTQYVSSANPAENSNYNRLYEQDDSRSYTHTINVGYPGMKKLLLNNRSLGGVEIAIAGTASFNNTTNSDKVLDMDALTGKFNLNNYLTNTAYANSKDIIPELNISKTFYKLLTNRYSKYVSIAINLRNQYFSIDHHSSFAFQNFSYSYSKFIPHSEIRYHNHQYGDYEMDYRLNFSTGVSYPGVQDIAPITDSANLWYIPKGNSNIKPQYKKEMGFNYNFATRKRKDPLILKLDASIGRSDDYITDSTLYNNAGVRTVYTVNLNGNKFATGGVDLKKSIELKNKNTVEAETKYTVNTSRNPQYLNSILNINKSTLQTAQFILGYRFKDIVTLKFEEGMNFYNSDQNFGKSRFKSNNQYTRVTGALQLPKKLVWSTNITHNKSASNNSEPVLFTIWNANLTYRFLKSKQGEIKFSALDLLRQNKGIVNTSDGNSQVLTSTNVLQQYFMLTLSYYPRKFGK